jgi:hypothetical protein
MASAKLVWFAVFVWFRSNHWLKSLLRHWRNPTLIWKKQQLHIILLIKFALRWKKISESHWTVIWWGNQKIYRNFKLAQTLFVNVISSRGYYWHLICFTKNHNLKKKLYHRPSVWDFKCRAIFSWFEKQLTWVLARPDKYHSYLNRLPLLGAASATIFKSIAL